MRRTLAVLVTTAALLVPATAASADHRADRTNASCNSKNGGNYDRTHHGVKESDRCTPPSVVEDEEKVEDNDDTTAPVGEPVLI